jgi:hypothetical protein
VLSADLGNALAAVHLPENSDLLLCRVFLVLHLSWG